MRKSVPVLGSCVLGLALIAGGSPSVNCSGHPSNGSQPTGQVESTSELRQNGIDAFNRGDLTQARQCFEELVRHDPSGRSYSYLATVEFHAGDYVSSIEHFEKALRLGYATSSVHFNLGLAYLKVNKRNQAVNQLRLAGRLDPSSAETQYTLGVALLDANNPREALPHLTAASARMPHDPAVLCNLVRAELAAGDSTSALRRIDRITSSWPENAELAVTLAEICMKYQQSQKARTLLENASALEPQNPAVKLMLVKASLAAGEPVEAQAVLTGLPPETGKPGEIEYLAAQATALQDHLAEAQSHITRAIQADPGNVDFLIAQAWIQQLNGKYEAAIATLNGASKLQPTRPDIAFRKAISDFLLMRYQQSAEDCTRAIQESPRYAEAFFVLGLSLLNQHDFAAAEQSLRQAAALDPQSPLIYYQLGIARLKMGRVGDSLEAFKHAIALNPRLPPAYFWRAQARNQLHDRPGAIADLETAVALEPDYTNAYFELGKLYQESGQKQKAIEAFNRNARLQSRKDEEDRNLMKKFLIPHP